MARDRSEENSLKMVTAKPSAKRKAASSKSLPPDASGRVLIETVTPSVDDGATPIKRVVGDWIVVEADVFSDGHETLGAEVLYRPSGDADWARSRLRLTEDDRWRGRFQVPAMGFYEYRVEAWRDSFRLVGGRRAKEDRGGCQ